MLLRNLRNRFALLGVVLTWLVGGVIALVGYRQMTTAVRHEAVARVEEAAESQPNRPHEFARYVP